MPSNGALGELMAGMAGKETEGVQACDPPPVEYPMVRCRLVIGALASVSASAAYPQPTLVRVNEVPPLVLKSGAANGPYRNGRLVDPAFVELAGTSKQIHDIKAYAAPRGWRTDCEAKAGSWNTLRLRFPPGTRQSDIETYFDTDLRLPARANKIAMVYGERGRSAGCVRLP